MGCGASSTKYTTAEGSKNRHPRAEEANEHLPTISEAEGSGQEKDDLGSSLKDRRKSNLSLEFSPSEMADLPSEGISPSKSCRSKGSKAQSNMTSNTSSLAISTPATVSGLSGPPTPQSGGHPTSVCSVRTTGTQDQYAEPYQTIIFFDWDDTLFPTTWLDKLGLARSKEAPTDPVILAELEKIENSACALVELASKLSTRTCIVTNAATDWVTNTAKIFMPRLHKLLESSHGPRIVYAIQTFQKQKRKRGGESVTDSVEWREGSMVKEEAREFLTKAKEVAMKEEVTAFYSQYSQQSWKNVISIGDADYERDAIQEVTFVHDQPFRKKLRTKVFKLAHEPTPTQVDSQLQTISMFLPSVVQFDEDLDVDFDNFNGQSSAEALGKVLQLPSVSKLLSNCHEFSPELSMIIENEKSPRPAASAGACHQNSPATCEAQNHHSH